MRCRSCGNENTDSKKFCTSCGKPLAGATEKKGSKALVIGVIAAFLFCILVAAAVLIPLIVIAAGKPSAEVTAFTLARPDGNTLDPDKVPLDTELVLKATYRSRFNEKGSGNLQIFIADSTGEKIIDKTFDVTSSGGQQVKEHKFTMEQGSGKPLLAHAKLSVKQGDKKLDSEKTLTMTMVAGKGAELQFTEAKNAAVKKCQDATDKIKSTSAQGIDVNDLADRLSKALGDLKIATTAEECDAAAGKAQTVIDECDARIAAAAQNAKWAEICRQNQAEVKRRLADWWSGSGTFPNTMSELYGLPVCPAGGEYTYSAPDTTPATLHVSCSIHGEL